MINRFLLGVAIGALLASPCLAQSATQLYEIDNKDFPERGHVVPTLASSNGADNFETCSGERMTVVVNRLIPKAGDCDSGPISPSLLDAYLGKPVFQDGAEVGKVFAFALDKDGQFGGLVIDPTQPNPDGKGFVAAMKDWTLGPVDGNYSVMLSTPLTDLQSQVLAPSPS